MIFLWRRNLDKIFSGVQPTGNLHIGNYLGAIKNFVKLQNSSKHTTNYYCVVDLHAITVWQDPIKLKKDILETVACFIASGIDPKKSIIFNQSKVASHSELAWILNCVCRMGWLNRMTQFKEKAGKNRENVSVGLFTYPVLMASDILAYKSNKVPVGEDQKQHLELARDIAKKFNNDFQVDFFPEVEPLIFGGATRVMSLRNGLNKMSKSDISDYSRINIMDNKDLIINKIKKAKTDSNAIMGEEVLEETGNFSEEIIQQRPEACNLLQIYSAISETSVKETLKSFEGKEFRTLKEMLAETLIQKILPIGHEVRKMLKEKNYLIEVLQDGAYQAKEHAEENLKELKNIIGFI